MKTTTTDYATMRKNFGKNMYDTYATAMWWLKGSGSYAYVDGSGSMSKSGLDSSSRQGVRPVITIKLQ